MALARSISGASGGSLEISIEGGSGGLGGGGGRAPELVGIKSMKLESWRGRKKQRE